VQIVYIWSSWCHCHPEIPSSSASVKYRPVLPFWYRLTHVVLEKRPLNGCSSLFFLQYGEWSWSKNNPDQRANVRSLWVTRRCRLNLPPRSRRTASVALLADYPPCRCRIHATDAATCVWCQTAPESGGIHIPHGRPHIKRGKWGQLTPGENGWKIN